MGQPVVHWELWSKDPQRVSDFYARAFGWSVTHIPELDYRLVDTGGVGGINGGIMTPQPGPWPGNLALYIDVPHLADHVQKVRDAGGRVFVERQEIPHLGAFALFEDPDGRVMGIWEQLPKSPGTPKTTKKKAAKRR